MNHIPDTRRNVNYVRIFQLSWAIITVAVLIASWIDIRLMEYGTRESLLLNMAASLVVLPTILLVLPRSMLLSYPFVVMWSAILGFRYCGDMGGTGHMFTAVLVVLAAFWAMLLGAAVFQLRKKEQTRRSVESIDSILAPSAWINILLMVLAAFYSVTRISAWTKLSRERAVVAASLEQFGMHIYFSGQSVSIQCNDPEFNDRQFSEVIEHLRKVKNLKILNLSFSGITDKSLKEIKSLESLEDLCLYKTGVTDAGVDDLSEMKQLERLRIDETLVSGEGLVKLKAALPDCVIH